MFDLLTHSTRRSLLQAGTGIAMAAGVWPTAVLANDPVDAAFAARKVDDVLAALGVAPKTAPQGLGIDAPDIAENGAVVPVGVKASLPGLEYVALIGEKNPVPLIAVLYAERQSAIDANLRIKMGETSNLRLVAKTRDGAFAVSKEVRITVGGCAG
jgi:sulfur-oxidizing protein SoxY